MADLDLDAIEAAAMLALRLGMQPQPHDTILELVEALREERSERDYWFAQMENADEASEKHRNTTQVLAESLRRMVLYIEAEAQAGDGIREEAWDDYQAAREITCAGKVDSAAASRGIDSILKSIRDGQAKYG